MPRPGLSFLIGFCRCVRPGYAHRKTPNALSLQASETLLRSLKTRVIRHRLSVTEALAVYCRAHGLHSDAWKVMWRSCAQQPGKHHFDAMMKETGSPRFSPRLAGLDETDCISMRFCTYNESFRRNGFAAPHHSKCRDKGCRICYHKARARAREEVVRQEQDKYE